MNQIETIRNENGFTLIETLMAMAIISIGLLGLAALQTSAITGNSRAQKQSMAILLAGNRIEAYKNMPYGSIPSTPTTVEDGETLSPWGIFTRTTVIQLVDMCPGISTPCPGAIVTVTVSWPGRDVARPVFMQTTIAQKPSV